MFRHRNSICLVAVLILGVLLGARGDEGTTSLPAILRANHVLALVPWSADGADLLWTFTNQGKDSAHRTSPEGVRISVYQQHGANLAKIFESKLGDSLLDAHTLQENGRFIVIGITGSAYHVEVYAYLNGAVRKVLDTGSRSTPEILFDDSGDEFLLFNDMEMVGGEWRSSAGYTRVFHWNGKEYEAVGKVPWTRRLRCLSKESCAVLN